MKIVYQDDSVLECSTIEIADRHLYVDDIYIVHVEDVKRIEE